METETTLTGGPLPAPGYETCTITGPNGQRYTAGGAAMSGDGRRLVCYVTGVPYERKATTWQGDVLGTARVVSTWNMFVPGAYSRVRLSAVRVRLTDGRVYAGRMSFDSTQLFRGRLVKS